jgi:phage baseplate assembly protein W
MPKYTDIDLLFTKNELTNDVNLKYDNSAVVQSIKNIVLTTKGEKIFDSRFGGNVYDLQFDDLSPLELQIFKGQIRANLGVYEPRATIQNIDIVNSLDGYWNITITYSLVYNQSQLRDVQIKVNSNS